MSTAVVTLVTNTTENVTFHQLLHNATPREGVNKQLLVIAAVCEEVRRLKVIAAEQFYPSLLLWVWWGCLLYSYFVWHVCGIWMNHEEFCRCWVIWLNIELLYFNFCSNVSCASVVYRIGVLVYVNPKLHSQFLKISNIFTKKLWSHFSPKLLELRGQGWYCWDGEILFFHFTLKKPGYDINQGVGDAKSRKIQGPSVPGFWLDFAPLHPDWWGLEI